MCITHSIEFINVSVQKFPNSLFMKEYRGCLLCFEKKWSNALEDFNAILKEEPNNIMSLYLKAFVLHEMQRSDEVIDGLNLFLSLAPKDHRKVPMSYYILAECYLSLKNVTKAKEFYEKGLVSEDDQLPCFRPYDSPRRDLLKLLFQAYNGDFKRIESDSPSTESKSREEILNDFRRVSLIKQMRYSIQINLNFIYQNLIPQNLETIKYSKEEIYLKDINYSKSHKIHDSKLKLKIIDGTYKYDNDSSLMYVAEDEHGLTENLIIKKLNFDEKNLKIGNQILVESPYVITSFDQLYENSFILVDDACSMKIIEDTKKDICRFCCRENSKYFCSICNITKYCSKECQVHDWKVLKHKLICSQQEPRA